MRCSILPAVCIATLSGCTGGAATAQAPKTGWSLVWADEFEGDELDRTKWKPEESCWGGGNQERQCYTDRPANVSVEGGMLRLKARKEKFTGPDRPPEIAERPNPRTTQDYTSGKVRTLGLASWKYGKVEFRARPPKGQGTWPAIWMMPAKPVYGGWPRSGEIDILEGVNLGAKCETCQGSVGENRMISALHFGDFAPHNKFLDTRVSLASQALPSDDFHIWTLEWGEGLMRFYLDGQQYWEVKADQWSTASPLAKSNPVAPFDQPFYIMANLAIGGGLSEKNNDKGVAANVTPAEFLIDWVRIYQCAEDMEKGLACMQGAEEGK
ncbi:MAG: glycoside hydrolase family 16 protein [Sphingomonadaceae bacterium]|nr:glycoside hydrolase family 16 protein [Sphingomonadaceae bacterium]